MRVSDAQQVEAMVKAATAPEDLRQKLQISLLKKSLDVQEQQAAELLRLMEGKGRVVDLRV
jgi:hypothetical protein